MIKSVVRSLYWNPDIIGKLFIDNIDYLGLEYWYNDVRDVSASFKNK